jgi:hypothetical protein
MALYWKPFGSQLTTGEYQLVNQARGAFGVVRLVQALWQNTLESFSNRCLINRDTPMGIATGNWQVQPELTINPHAPCMDGCRLNAYYDSKAHELVFPQFRDKERNTRYTCSSFDVVAHEAGHAVLDAMCPQLLRSGRLDHKAVHETFGDLTALFASLAVASVQQQVEWLESPHLGTCIGGDLIGTCIRDIYVPSSSVPSCEEHALSRPLTQFICRYMQHVWQTTGQSSQQVLRQVRRDFLEAILLNVNAKNILTAIVGYFNRKASIDSNYLVQLMHQFTACTMAA